MLDTTLSGHEYNHHSCHIVPGELTFLDIMASTDTELHVFHDAVSATGIH